MTWKRAPIEALPSEGNLPGKLRPVAAEEAAAVVHRQPVDQLAHRTHAFLGRDLRARTAHEERLLARDAAATAEKLDWASEPWKALTSELKESSGKKGRELFHPLRLALTGRESGPEMAGIVERMGRDRAVRRLEAAARR